MYPSLPESYKNRFNFQLATTSFIYPDNIVPNVKALSPFIDQIELLFFEADPIDGLLPEDDIKSLVKIADNTGISYNIHLPIDISITNFRDKNDKIVQSFAKIIRLTRPLNPATFTLHLPFNDKSPDEDKIWRWQKKTCEQITKLLEIIGIEGRKISIETLDYPFEWAWPVIQKLDLSVCLDIGHLIIHGYDFVSAYELYGSRTEIFHIHGADADKGKDHLGLDKLSASHLSSLFEILKKFTKIVSIEVFSYEKLVSSMDVLKVFPEY